MTGSLKLHNHIHGVCIFSWHQLNSITHTHLSSLSNSGSVEHNIGQRCSYIGWLSLGRTLWTWSIVEYSQHRGKRAGSVFGIKMVSEAIKEPPIVINLLAKHALRPPRSCVVTHVFTSHDVKCLPLLYTAWQGSRLKNSIPVPFGNDIFYTAKATWLKWP